jgi:hypothetical protein
VRPPDIGGTIQVQSAGTGRPAFSSLRRWAMKRCDSVWWSVIFTPARSKDQSTARFSSTSARSRHSVDSRLVSSPIRFATTGSRL